MYPLYQLGWFPDYSDADNYMSPFFQKDNFLKNHYNDPAVDRAHPAAGRRDRPAKRLD